MSHYRIYDSSECYYMTFTVVNWVDVFTRKRYRDIVIESFDYCRKNKGLQLWAYVIMSNHIHLIASAKENNLSDVIRDFKRHTARKILTSIQEEPESRRDWMLNLFSFEALKGKYSSDFQFWIHSNHAKIIETEEFLYQKINYIHNNPVKAGLVEFSEEWLYSSQRNYAEKYAILEIDLIKE